MACSELDARAEVTRRVIRSEIERGSEEAIWASFVEQKSRPRKKSFLARRVARSMGSSMEMRISGDRGVRGEDGETVVAVADLGRH